MVALLACQMVASMLLMQVACKAKMTANRILTKQMINKSLMSLLSTKNKTPTASYISNRSKSNKFNSDSREAPIYFNIAPDQKLT